MRTLSCGFGRLNIVSCPKLIEVEIKGSATNPMGALRISPGVMVNCKSVGDSMLVSTEAVMITVDVTVNASTTSELSDGPGPAGVNAFATEPLNRNSKIASIRTMEVILPFPDKSAPKSPSFPADNHR